MRQMSVAGTFYPDEEVELQRYFEHFNKIYNKNNTLANLKAKAVIVPHAGYIYSGYTANIAYKTLHNSKIKNYVVIGPSHRVGFDGISLCQEQNYATPSGNIKSSEILVNELKDKFHLQTILNPHAEHSTEVQFPFIKHYLNEANIVELVYGHVDSESISKIINFILEKDDFGVIISTDLSHFHNLKDANKIDNICLNAIKTLDIKLLQSGCEACGITGVEAMIKSANSLGLTSTILDYRTSADASEDTSKVVGYLSACFI